MFGGSVLLGVIKKGGMIMKKRLVAGLVSGLFIISAGFSAFGGRTANAAIFQAGEIDGFTLPPDIATPSPELAAILTNSYGGFQNFDLVANVNGGSDNTQVAHTFTGLPSHIFSATLEMRVFAGSGWMSGESTDGLILSFVDSSTTEWVDDIVYKRTFGPYTGSGTIFSDPDAGLLKSSPWSIGDDFTFTLDLSVLPLAAGGALNLFSSIEDHGFLDVTVSDETGVDYMKLNVNAVPIPGAVWLLGSGLAGIIGLRRKARK